ncbi:MAG TPA: DUF6088 family protein [Treponemataceae bacterium]|nr:DUF6088 family protein [Treponemataceae bacterium]
MSLSIERRILYRIRAKGRGWVFSARHFADFGSRSGIDLALHRLSKQGKIRRLGQGLYDYPRIHEKIGVLSPSIEAVAREIADKNNSKLKIVGSQAANALGITTQVPAKIVFLTDGPTRQIKIGNQTIQLKHASPKVMTTADNGSGVVIEALKYVGRENIDERTIRKIKGFLSEFDKKELQKNLNAVPEWMKPRLLELITD